jgi:hypothetical protein
MLLPEPRGPLTRALVDALRRGDPEALPEAPAATDDPLLDDDLQLALWILFELHYRGFAEVADWWEWQPEAIGLRRTLEGTVLDALRRDVEVPADRRPVPDRLLELVEADDGPPLSKYLQTDADHRQFLEFAVHRSIYQLKEADPHSWALPRLDGRAKAALVEIQADEYGGGRPSRLHARLFADTMDALGLDSRYGAYLEQIPAVTLATVNLMSLLGLHRRWRGAIVGHLALFEITSPVPNRRYGNALRRLGFDRATRFYDEHVEADAVHETLAANDLAGALATDDPGVAADILFGARSMLLVDVVAATRTMHSFEAGVSSLRRPLAIPAAR